MHAASWLEIRVIYERDAAVAGEVGPVAGVHAPRSGKTRGLATLTTIPPASLSAHSSLARVLVATSALEIASVPTGVRLGTLLGNLR